MTFKDPKKEVRWFWKTEFNGNKPQEKIESEEKVLELNAREKKWNNNNYKFFKGECNTCGKYDHRAKDCWVNRNKGN